MRTFLGDSKIFAAATNLLDLAHQMDDAKQEGSNSHDMLKRIRSLTRFAVALILWAHATFLFDVPRAGLVPLFSRLHTSEGEAAVLVLIAGFSVLASYGWGKVTVDLISLLSKLAEDPARRC